MRIIISGGLGYVGGRLSKYLAEQGHTVVALSRQANDLPLIHLPAGMTIQHPDIFIESPGKLSGFDSFIHLAALNENDCVKYPEKAIDVNITQTLHWLDRAQQTGIRQFVYFSTAHVYGRPLEGHYDEDSLTKPAHPYAITHKCAEDYVLSYRSEKSMNNLVIRLTNAFGGPAFPTVDRWTLLVNDLCRSAVEKGSMILLSDGLQSRDFIGLNDVCRGTNHLMTFTDRAALNGIFNLGSGASKSVWDMAIRVKEVSEGFLQKPISLSRHDPDPSSIPSELCISMDKLCQTGFTFADRTDNEIVDTLKYFMNRNPL